MKKEKITISLDSNLLAKIDEKIDKINFKNRSNVIENFIRDWLKLKNDIWALIIANDINWNDSIYPLEVPKILINVDWKTLLEKHIEMLENAWIKNVIIAIADWKKMIKDFLKKMAFSLNIQLLEVDVNDKTQEVVEKAKKFILQDKLIILLWDNYHNNFDLLDFIYFHNSSWTNLTIAVKANWVSEPYGNIRLEWNNIVDFVEKPKTKNDITYIINAWIYLIQTDLIPETWKNLKIETDFFPDYVATNKAKAYFHNGNWFHVQDDKTLEELRI